MSTGTLEYSLTNLSKRFPSPPSSLQTTVTVSFVFQSYTQHTHSDDDPPARLRFNLKWGHRAGFPALHSGTAQSNASLSSLSTPTNLTVATTEVSAAACYYVRGGGEEKESATDKTSCSRARAVKASGCSAHIWCQRQEHPLVSLDALFNTQHISMCS